MYKRFLIRRITRYNGQWYCYLCESILQNLETAEHHSQEAHLNNNTETESLNKSLELSNEICKDLVNHGIVMIIGISLSYFCVPCQSVLHTSDHINEHIREKKHQKCIQANIISKDSTNNQQNSSYDTNIKQSNISIKVENLQQPINKIHLPVKVQQICENQLENVANDFTTNQVDVNNYASYPREDETYKRFLIKCITYYNGQWYCYLCNSMLQNLTSAERHSQEVHSDIDTNIFNKSFELSNKTFRNIVNKGIIMGIAPQNYFCLFCQCALFNLDNVDRHIIGKRHKKCTHANTVSKDTTNNQQSTSYNANIKQSNISINVENLQQSMNKLHLPMIQQIRENESENLSNNFTINQIVVNNYAPYPREDKMYKHFLIRCITHYNGQWYCYLCNSALESLINAEHHSQEAHSDINMPINFLNKSVELSNEVCKNIVNHGIIMGIVPQNYFCILCQISLPSLNHVDGHIKGKKHQKCIQTNAVSKNSTNNQQDSNIQTELLNKSKSVKLSNKIHDKLINHGIIMGDASQNYFCTFCQRSLLSLHDIDGHIKGKKHQKCMQTNAVSKNSTNNQQDSNIQTEFLNKSGSVKLSNEIHDKLINHRIVIRDASKDYFYTFCQCPLPTLNHIDGHIKGKKHQKCMQTNAVSKDSTNNQQDSNIQTEFLNKSGSMKLSNEIHDKLINHRIVIRDASKDYFCTLCRCLLSSLHIIDIHIKGKKHQKYMQNNITLKDSTDDQENLCYDNLVATHRLHCQKEKYQYLKKNDDIATKSLPQSLQKLFEEIDETVADLLKMSDDVLNDSKLIQLKDALKHTFEFHHFPVEIHVFGSRFTGLALPYSDIDIYLNFGDECTEDTLMQSRCKEIQSCLNADYGNWEIELILNESRTPIIRVKHILTGLKCDISYQNGLSLENSKLIKSFIVAYPPCRKLILFLKKWLLLGNLNGLNRITNYALSWLVIFYLQVKYKIPNIAALIKNHNQSKIISGWETGVGDTIYIDIPELPMHELLLGFFEYYKSFDYMHYVICPLLGTTCNKRSFAITSSTIFPVLPNSMSLYIAQLQKNKPEYFRVYSPMCVQDPFDLAHNLTKTISVSTLKCFKQYCNDSALILKNVILQL